MVANDYQYILQNMQKELEVQAEKVGNLTKERDNAGKQIGAIEAQLSETKVVLDELEIVGEDATIYKLLGPVLVKQDKELALQTIKNRKSHMETELKRCSQTVNDVGKKITKEQDNLRDLHMKSQHVKQALMGAPQQ
ncbi:unnamed protein product [Oikopleura dioica]|uniref:Prefoldin subunit 6 n=1 Tax=Oikopleura dioica TaxID=34765 RepID=E4Y733_OIKDI|nr:unnamed protein product [Oikopleura dioica]